MKVPLELLGLEAEVSDLSLNEIAAFAAFGAKVEQSMIGVGGDKREMIHGERGRVVRRSLYKLYALTKGPSHLSDEELEFLRGLRTAVAQHGDKEEGRSLGKKVRKAMRPLSSWARALI